MAAHVALGAVILTRSQQFLEYLSPIPHRLVVYLYDDIFDDGRADSFVGQGKMNVRRIAGLVLENWPNCRAHLLALHPSRITGNTQSQESDKGRDHRVVSAGAARYLFLRHEGRSYRRPDLCQLLQSLTNPSTLRHLAF